MYVNRLTDNEVKAIMLVHKKQDTVDRVKAGELYFVAQKHKLFTSREGLRYLKRLDDFSMGRVDIDYKDSCAICDWPIHSKKGFLCDDCIEILEERYREILQKEKEIKTAEAQEVAEVQKEVEAQKAVEVQKTVEIQKAAEVQKEVKAQKDVEIQKAAEVQKEVEAQKAAEVRKEVEAQSTAEVQKTIEAVVASQTEKENIKEENKAEKITGHNLYFLRKNVLAIALLLMIFVYSGVNMYVNLNDYKELVTKEVENVIDKKSKINVAVASLESNITEPMYHKMDFLEIYSYVHVLLGKEEIIDFKYIKDKLGNLNYGAFYRDHDDNIVNYALRVRKLKDYVEGKGGNVLFVLPPAKYNSKDSEYSLGLPGNDPSRTVDELMFYLNRFEVSTLNFADYMPNKDMSYDSLFYKTDHHWTVDTAFEASKILLEKLNDEFGCNLDGSYYLDRNNFERVTYKDAMFGSMGRGAGVCFSGLEDYVALYPKWDMNFYRETILSDGRMEKSKGGYLDTILDTTVFKEANIYKNLSYALYLSAVKPSEHIENLDNPEGPKVLFIRDSYFSPVISFLMPFFGTVDALWTVNSEDSTIVEEKLYSEDYDFVIIEAYPYNINESAFQFFIEE